MAIYGSDDVGFFLLGGYNLLGSLTQFTDKTEAVLEESHTLGDSWREVAWVGVQQAEISQNGFYQDGTLSAHEALSTGPGVDRVLCFNVEGNVSGKNFVGWAGAMEVDYTRIAARGELTKADANYRSNGIIEQGKILFPLSSGNASAGNTTAAAIDGGASSTAGGAGYLQITALTNATVTGFSVDIMHSADNLSFTSWAGFAAASAAPYAERKASTAVIQRYAAIKYAGATATNPAFTMFVGLARTAS